MPIEHAASASEHVQRYFPSEMQDALRHVATERSLLNLEQERGGTSVIFYNIFRTYALSV